MNTTGTSVLISRELAGDVLELLSELITTVRRELSARPSRDAAATISALYAALHADEPAAEPAAAVEPVAWLSVAEAAAQRECSPQLIRRMAREGKLPARRVGHEWLVSLTKPSSAAS